MNSKDWQQIVAEMKRGDNRFLKLIFEEHASYCIHFLQQNHGCSREEAEDIFTESVLTFRENAVQGKIEFMKNLRAYLFSTCKRKFLNLTAKRKRQEGKVSDLQLYFEEYLEAYDPGKEHLREHQMAVALKALEVLSEKCRKILEFFYLDRISMTEIASLMGFSNANVAKTTKSRCFKKLMEEVKLRYKPELGT